MIILTLDRIIAYLNYFGISLNDLLLSDFEQAIIIILGNILWFVILFFAFNLLYKILSRLVNSIF